MHIPESRGAQSGPNYANQQNQESKAPPGAYNPADYSNLKVDKDVKELFEYIS